MQRNQHNSYSTLCKFSFFVFISLVFFPFWCHAGTSPKADVIFVLDNSGSMADEIIKVQQQINSFSANILLAGVDLHVVMISTDICVPYPLGNGTCPNDENLPGYRHIDVSVASSDSFEKLINTYPTWKDSLRTNAARSIIVVSDDNSAMTADWFNTNLLTLDPTFQGYIFHAAAGDYDDTDTFDPCIYPPVPPKPFAASRGAEYINLVNLTGGVLENLCDQTDFSSSFSSMADAIIADALNRAASIGLTCFPAKTPDGVISIICF